MANNKVVGKGASNPLLAGTVRASSINTSKVALDIAQSRFFTITLYNRGIGSTNPDKKSISVTTSVRKNTVETQLKDYLPLKGVSFNMASINSTKIIAGVFSDLPLPTSTSFAKMTLITYDSHLDEIEKQLREWYSRCIVSTNGTVAYLDDMVGSIKYESFGVDGKPKPNLTCYSDVILDGDITVSRDYESSGFKEITFSLILLSDVASYS